MDSIITHWSHKRSHTLWICFPKSI